MKKKSSTFLAAFLSVFVWMSPNIAWAASEPETALRYPFVLLGLCITVAGFAVAQVHRAWWELSAAAKPARVAGITVASVGVFVLAFGATEAPPSLGELPWKTSWEEALAEATRTQKPILVDFQADWCAACHELEAEVFHHPSVKDRMKEEVVLLRVDFDQETPQNAELAKKFRVSGLPTIGFATPAGELMERPSFEGKVDVDEFIARFDLALGGGAGAKDDSELARALESGGLWSALLLVFLAGVMASLTPCVYPLIPITIGLFGARGAATRTEGFRRSLVYVLGIVVTYSVLGVAAASAGSVFGNAMQSPWVVGAIAALFFVLGLGSVGLFNVRLPAGVQTKLGQVRGVGLGGAFAMGLVAGVIAAPCVGPIVAGILLIVAAQQDVWLGLILLATFALGMGQLFLILGTFSSALSALPKSGGWMDGVKTVFGAVFIGMALYYGRFLVPEVGDALRQVWLLVG